MKRTPLRRTKLLRRGVALGGAPQGRRDSGASAGTNRIAPGPPKAMRGLSLVKDYRKRLDALCREVVMLRDRMCQWCGSTSRPLQWCHINSRRYPSTRWSLNNTLALCAGCHLNWHHKPLEAAAWFERTFPERVLALRIAGGGKVDPHGVFIYLTQEKRRLEQESDRAIGGAE